MDKHHYAAYLLSRDIKKVDILMFSEIDMMNMEKDNGEFDASVKDSFRKVIRAFNDARARASIVNVWSRAVIYLEPEIKLCYVAMDINGSIVETIEVHVPEDLENDMDVFLKYYLGYAARTTAKPLFEDMRMKQMCEELDAFIADSLK